ncbi:uncharacterized protein F4812DRAFT_235202 [Daldinia caldariorum]|uniref:uncharacterized protein n=1 Tax=Daldinia caldariorum TaxID=326644 RepID=UPI00200847EA|nr:uncharacterized protein F4812DRAFT_235202 [Daldinia caldariorum]KAI1463603.1 hypothetical protein F4812DRAFT_235202 [Daldinia caldariorum]
MTSTTPDNPVGLLDLPADILVMRPDFLHNIEDYLNLSATCGALRKCLDAPSRTVLRLARVLRSRPRAPAGRRLPFLQEASAGERGALHCQGLEGLGMMMNGNEIAERFKPRIRERREGQDRARGGNTVPAPISMGDWETHEYPNLWGDIQVCFEGYYMRA